MTNNNFLPLSADQIKLLSELTGTLSPSQINWLSGYFLGLAAQAVKSNELPALTSQTSTSLQSPPSGSAVVTTKPLTILYGSRTGNGEGVAKQALTTAQAAGFDAKLKSMESYKNNDLKGEKNLLVIISTHGEGEPPFQAKAFYEFLYSKRAPKLEGVNFAVLALGDSSYLRFCQTGIEFDARLEELGATRILNRVDCDVNFRVPASEWVTNVLNVLNDGKVSSAVASLENVAQAGSGSDNFNKENPYQAQVLDKTFLHGRDSNRQTLHVELSLENSGLSYEPGDSLGVYATNPPELVDALLETVHLSPSEQVTVNGNAKTLHQALFSNYELTQITPDVLNRYAKLTENEKIKQILETPESVKEFIYGKDLVDLFTIFPEQLSVEQFVSLLRPLQPRLYSISSSPLAYPDEVHLTVGVVKYNNGNRNKTGLCSVFLSDRIDDSENASVFVERNPNFRLPENPQTPIIMVGAGTGIAPYRAFVQHREAAENRGDSWLIFGNRHSESEFLYQLEWQKHLREGSLTRMDVAFSRDSNERVYVQHRILEQGKLVYEWLQKGAHFYVCGDMKKMARDVNAALLSVVQQYGGLSEEAAEEYINNLQQQRRYQTDVY